LFYKPGKFFKDIAGKCQQPVYRVLVLTLFWEKAISDFENSQPSIDIFNA
jgi:hypothetical protein